MALCNAHYYATRDPLGAAGDFVTAPEISQMFGELTGLWCADLWLRAGRPDIAWVELGPGRGTLAADALRAMARAGLVPPVHLVETSPTLRAAQIGAVPAAVHHDAIDTLPTDRPLVIVANEFFDALPIRQRVATAEGWRERLVTIDGDRFAATLGAAVPAPGAPPLPGTIAETSPASTATMRGLAARVAAQGGAILVVDYGGSGGVGDTLQAVARHAFADPFAAPGEHDLTAHVDFAALAAAAAPLAVHPPIGQGAWLTALGIVARADALARAAPERAQEIAAARERLVAPDRMGTLLKAMAVRHRDWPTPGGWP